MLDEYLQRITTVFPFEITSSKVLNDGWANAVVEINDEWIFRISRGELTKKQMAVESAFLPAFAKESPLPVPHVAFSGEGFMGYKKIQGSPFTSDVLKSLTSEERDLAARQLGAFLTSLHDYQFVHPDLCEYPYGGEDFWNEVWTVVAPLLSETVRTKAKVYFENAFAMIAAQKLVKTLTHSDLGTSNALFDVGQGRIAGVIDFGDMCIHDPARDFNGILRNHGREFTENVLRSYDRKIEGNFWDRIKFYAKKQDFQVIFYAPKFGFEQYIPERVKKIEQLFGV